MRVTGSIKRNSPFIIGVAGGSGSGKTYFARSLQQQLGTEVCEILYQDNYYIDQSKNFDFDGGSVNFDHPSSIDFNLLGKQLGQLKLGVTAEVPIYNFVTHARQPETLQVTAKPVIIVDGILIFHSSEVRAHFDDLIFFDTPENLRFERRMDRDVKERGREPGGVRNQFLKQVKPMHDQFVEPSKTFAKMVIKEMGSFQSMLQSYCEALKKKGIVL